MAPDINNQINRSHFDPSKLPSGETSKLKKLGAFLNRGVQALGAFSKGHFKEGLATLKAKASSLEALEAQAKIDQQSGASHLVIYVGKEGEKENIDSYRAATKGEHGGLIQKGMALVQPTKEVVYDIGSAGGLDKFKDSCQELADIALARFDRGEISASGAKNRLETLEIAIKNLPRKNEKQSKEVQEALRYVQDTQNQLDQRSSNLAPQDSQAAAKAVTMAGVVDLKTGFMPKVGYVQKPGEPPQYERDALGNKILCNISVEGTGPFRMMRYDPMPPEGTFSIIGNNNNKVDVILKGHPLPITQVIEETTTTTYPLPYDDFSAGLDVKLTGTEPTQKQPIDVSIKGHTPPGGRWHAHESQTLDLDEVGLTTSLTFPGKSPDRPETPSSRPKVTVQGTPPTVEAKVQDPPEDQKEVNVLSPTSRRPLERSPQRAKFFQKPVTAQADKGTLAPPTEGPNKTGDTTAQQTRKRDRADAGLGEVPRKRPRIEEEIEFKGEGLLKYEEEIPPSGEPEGESPPLKAFRAKIQENPSGPTSTETTKASENTPLPPPNK